MLKAQGEEVESESDGDDDEIREVVGGKNAAQPGELGPPPSAAQAQAALLAQQQGGILTAQQIAAMQAAAQPQIAAMQLPAAPPAEDQLSSLPPEIQARIKAARELAAKLTSQPAPPPMGAALGMAAAPWQAGAAPQAGAPGAAAAAPSAAAPAAPAAQPAAAANPILAAAQAAAARLAQEAGLPPSAYQQAAAAQQPAAPPPGVVVAPVPGAPGVAAPGVAPAAGAAAVPAAAPGRMQIPYDLAAMMLGPDGQLPAAAPAPGRMQIPSDLAAMMLGPDGQLPAAVPPGALPGAVPGAVPGALPGALPGMLPGGLPGAPSALAPQPAKHFETELEINDFPQHARWKVCAAGCAALPSANLPCVFWCSCSRSGTLGAPAPPWLAALGLAGGSACRSRGREPSNAHLWLHLPCRRSRTARRSGTLASWALRWWSRVSATGSLCSSRGAVVPACAISIALVLAPWSAAPALPCCRSMLHPGLP